MYLAPHQHELRHRLLEPQRAAGPQPTRVTPTAKRRRRRRLAGAFRARVA